MTIELTANCDPVPLSYEGDYLRVCLIASLPGRNFRNFYDCNEVHALRAVLGPIRDQKYKGENLRVVSPDEFFDWRKH